MFKYLLVTLLVLIVIAVGVAYPLWTGQLDVADPDFAQASKLADQLEAISSNLQLLATGALGLLGFLFSEKVSQFWKNAEPKQRNGILFGGALLLSSVMTGLITHWAIASVIIDARVRGSAPTMLLLQGLQTVELAIGVLFVTGIAARQMSK